MNFPKISIVIPTYNRASTINRAIDSVLAQTYTNYEIIIVDDGSTDNTNERLKLYNNEKIFIYKHIVNKGVCAAKNTGFDRIKGDWFTVLDSDDEIVPTALEELISVPLYIDDRVNAVSCNCLNATTHTFSGKGLDCNQYLNEETIFNKCSGEHWGITKTNLLNGERLNERIRGWENILWYKINAKSKRYYIHKALRIYHTEGDDRLCKEKPHYIEKANLYKEIIKEDFFLERLNKYKKKEFLNICIKGIIFCKMGGDKYNTLLWYKKYVELGILKRYKYLLFIIAFFFPKILLLTGEKIKNNLSI